jgi:hypothetical protein
VPRYPRYRLPRISRCISPRSRGLRRDEKDGGGQIDPSAWDSFAAPFKTTQGLYSLPLFEPTPLAGSWHCTSHSLCTQTMRRRSLTE